MLPQSIYHAACPLPTYSREQINDLKQPIDLREEIERDIGPGQRAGKWRKYRSPFRQDRKPSFGVSEGIFIDFATGARGDILTWLRDYRGLSFREALAWLNERSGGYTNRYDPQPRHVSPAQPDATNHMPPSAVWQQAALLELEQAERHLWSKAGAKVLTYLSEVRGLDDETIRHFRLGYNPTWKRTSYRRADGVRTASSIQRGSDPIGRDNCRLAHLGPGLAIPCV